MHNNVIGSVFSQHIENHQTMLSYPYQRIVRYSISVFQTTDQIDIFNKTYRILTNLTNAKDIAATIVFKGHFTLFVFSKFCKH